MLSELVRTMQEHDPIVTGHGRGGHNTLVAHRRVECPKRFGPTSNLAAGSRSGPIVPAAGQYYQDCPSVWQAISLGNHVSVV